MIKFGELIKTIFGFIPEYDILWLIEIREYHLKFPVWHYYVINCDENCEMRNSRDWFQR